MNKYPPLKGHGFFKFLLIWTSEQLRVKAKQSQYVAACCWAVGNLRKHNWMQVPHMATTLEIWSALPHSGLIRQSLVCKQHLGQLLPELLLSVASCLRGWVCVGCFSSHSSLSPLPMMLCFVWQKAGWMDGDGSDLWRKWMHYYIHVLQLPSSWSFKVKILWVSSSCAVLWDQWSYAPRSNP